MTFYTPDDAVNYIKSQIVAFRGVGDELVARLRAVSELKTQAIKNNDQPSIGRLIVMQGQVKDLLQEHIQLEQKLKPYAEYFGVQLGFLPLVLGAGAIAVAALLYLHFQKVANQKQALDMIAKGMINPQQAERLLDSNLGFGSILGGTMGLMAPWVAGVVALWAYLQFKKD